MTDIPQTIVIQKKEPLQEEEGEEEEEVIVEHDEDDEDEEDDDEDADADADADGEIVDVNLVGSKAAIASGREGTVAVGGDDICLEDPPAVAAAAAAASGAASLGGNKRKRLCRHPNCQRVIKSQGHCQRHGAKAKRCKVHGCDKQAQGTHDGMCKRHWKAIHFPDTPKAESQPPQPEGESVYDTVLPQSIAYRPSLMTTAGKGGAGLPLPPLPPPPSSSSTSLPSSPTHNVAHMAAGGIPLGSPSSPSSQPLRKGHASTVNGNTFTTTTTNMYVDPLDPPPPPEGTGVMPLVAFLRNGIKKESGWHRNEERRARGLYPVTSLSSQLEPWERQLVCIYIYMYIYISSTIFRGVWGFVHAFPINKEDIIPDFVWCLFVQ